MPVQRTEHSNKHERATTDAEKVWWVYMVRSANGYLYTGISTDPQRRFVQHQRGKGARFFNRSPAVALVWYERCANHSDALCQERAVKGLAKTTKERLIIQFTAELSISNSGCAVPGTSVKLNPLLQENIR